MTVAREFVLPDLGEGLTEAEIVSWLVQPGDIVAVDQPVVEVESAKSTVELPSPFAGRIEKLHAAEGDTVLKGGVLITVAEVAADIVPGTALRPDERDAGSGAVLIGYGIKESLVRAAHAPGRRFGGRAATATAPRSPVVSPLVRRRALDHGIDATQLRGSGPGSLVTRRDVDAAIAAREAVPAPATAPAAPGDQRIPIAGLRKVIATRLSHSRSTIPEATIWLDVDATELFAAKERLQKSTGERYSLTALIARFAVVGLGRCPILNSSVDDEAGDIVQHASIGLGLAAQTPRGLMVPVIHEADAMTTSQLRDAVADLVARAGTGDFSPAELAGGTFTLNNYGGFGVDGSTPIINHPEVATLGIGRIIDRPWVVDGQLAVRKVTTLALSFDHRLVDG
ncbi:MAG: dihydrolipoamide acetyltransferase family protein, partial [Leifsonia sp.]